MADAAKTVKVFRIKFVLNTFLFSEMRTYSPLFKN